MALTAEAPPWDPPSPVFSKQERSMIDYRGLFVIPKAPASLFTLSIFMLMMLHMSWMMTIMPQF